MLVVHSKCWRSSHWTYEFQYFFQIMPNTRFTAKLFAENKLRQVTGAEAAAVKKNVFGDPPSWFAPKDVSEYEIWVLDTEPNRNFKVLIDRQTGVIFASDYQV